jgi:hypothetical protein
MNHGIYLELCLPPSWDRIELVRQAVALSVDAVVGDADFKDAIAMVASELLENAVKYGKPGCPLRLVVEEHPEWVAVRVSNRVDPGSAHASVLADRIAWLKTFAHPRDAYTAALEQAFAEATDGGLGIVRIAYEGQCAVECDLSQHDEITVVARCERTAPTGSPVTTTAFSSSPL